MHGNYNTHLDKEILAHLDGMTVDEKLIILSLDFQIVWYYWWLNNEFNMSSYFHIKNKYISITNDNGKRIRRLIEQSKNGNYIWEIPKGRRNHRESEIQCAIRELGEETGMKKDDFQLLAMPPVKISHTDNNVIYTAKYFIADIINNKNITISYDIETMGEISEIKWMPIDDIRVIDQFNRLVPLCKDIMHRYKRYNNNIIQY